MLAKYTYRNLAWVDLESPTHEEIRRVVEEYRIHPLVAHDLTAPTFKPRVDLYDNCIYLILHFPARRAKRGREETAHEIDFVIGRDFIITTRYDTVDVLHQFSKVFEVNSILDRSNIGEHAGYIFYYMVTRLYENLMGELESIKRAIGAAEREVFAGKEREMVVALSNISRGLLDFKRAMSLHKEILRSFEVAGEKFFGHEFSYHLRAITSEYYKVEDAVENNAEALMELRETNNSLLSTKQNEQVRMLTVIAFITLPLSLIVALFQIDAVSRPLIGGENDFWKLVALLGLVGIALFGLFKHKRWL